MNIANFFRSADTESKPVLVIPKLTEMRVDAYRADLRSKIDAQLEAAARQLAAANFWLWPRRCMTPAIERWDAEQLRFVGMDLYDFCSRIESLFRVCTDDNVEWRLDRVIGARLWEWCCKPGALPVANFDIELAKRIEAENGKKRDATKQTTIRRKESTTAISARSE
jgi:hypothetical protein